MTPRPEQVARGVVSHINDHVVQRTLPEEVMLKDKLAQETFEGRWGEVAQTATELGRIGQLKDELVQSAAAYLTALMAFADLDIPSYEDEEASETRGIVLSPARKRGGRVSEFGEDSRYQVLGAILDLGGRLDREMAREILGEESTKAVARVISVAAAFRDDLRSIIGGRESMTVEELIKVASREGKITDPRIRDVYLKLAEKYGNRQVNWVIDEIFTARRGKEKTKNKGRSTEKPPIVFDPVCEKALASYLLREGVVGEIEEALQIDSLEDFAVKVGIIGSKDNLRTGLERIVGLTPRVKIEQKQCEQIKRMVEGVFIGCRQVAEIPEDQIASRLVAEIANKTKSKPVLAQQILDILFPSVRFNVHEDGLVEPKR